MRRVTSILWVSEAEIDGVPQYRIDRMGNLWTVRRGAARARLQQFLRERDAIAYAEKQPLLEAA